MYGPWRTGASGRPGEIPLPPARMPLWRDGRPLKQWRYVGVFGPEVMLCVAVARIGVIRVSWWAVWDRGSRTLAEATHRGRSTIRVERGRASAAEGPVSIELEWNETEGVETISPHGGSYIWTRKQGGLPVRGSVTVAERHHAIDGFGVIDESAGYHARHTAWVWSTGVGTLATGEPVAWNLVDGVHDAPEASERTVWVAGEPREVGPVRFRAGLEGIDELRFAAEASREHRENLLLLASEYEQPFGTFSGPLPGGGELAEGYGVMERHDVRW